MNLEKFLEFFIIKRMLIISKTQYIWLILEEDIIGV